MHDFVVILSICVIGVLGLCWGGFTHLSNRCSDIEKRVSFIDQKAGSIEVIHEDIKLIKEALLGTMDKKGIITRIHDHEQEIDIIRKICNERHK